MNNKIADIIANKIADLTWVDKLAGLVQTARINVGDPKVQKRFPISCNMIYEEICKTGTYQELMPDSKYKSIIYFEDGGVSFTGANQGRLYFNSRLRLVCWLNNRKLGQECGTAYLFIIDLFKFLNIPVFNQDNFSGIDIKIKSQAVRDLSIFGKYTYDEFRTQFLMYPFDFFALDLEVNFFIVPECFDINLSSDACL